MSGHRQNGSEILLSGHSSQARADPLHLHLRSAPGRRLSRVRTSDRNRPDIQHDSVRLCRIKLHFGCDVSCEAGLQSTDCVRRRITQNCEESRCMLNSEFWILAVGR